MPATVSRVGELVRAGSFVQCQCYAKDQAKGYLADGCGQFNVFEVVNDNNAYKNLDVFSTNMIGYGGYVGEGPCGPKCNAATLGQEVDLIAKSTNTEATAGATSTPTKGPGAAFRRPEAAGCGSRNNESRPRCVPLSAGATGTAGRAA